MNLQCSHQNEIEPRCPACGARLREVSEVTTRLGLAPSQIERLGTAQCEGCGEAWLYAICPIEADESEIRAELDRFTEFAENSLLEDSRGL